MHAVAESEEIRDSRNYYSDDEHDAERKRKPTQQSPRRLLSEFVCFAERRGAAWQAFNLPCHKTHSGSARLGSTWLDSTRLDYYEKSTQDGRKSRSLETPDVSVALAFHARAEK